MFMRLYHSPGTRGTRVVWTLEEIGEPYEVKIVTREDRGSDEHRQRHPLGRVPVIELDDGRTIFESAAVCLHLADLHPDAGLIPLVGTYERGLTYQWSVFAMAEVEKRVFGWLFAKRKGEDLTEHADGFAPIADALRDAVRDEPWLAGESFTVADILCASMIGNAFNRELLTEDGPLRDWAQRAQQRPANLRAEDRDQKERQPA
jgi:glutathione S-transferase